MKMNIKKMSEFFRPGERLLFEPELQPDKRRVTRPRRYRMTKPSQNQSNALGVAVDDQGNDLAGSAVFHFGPHEKAELVPQGQ